jgi:hypothetical protein
MELSVSFPDSFVLFVSFVVKDDRLCRLAKNEGVSADGETWVRYACGQVLLDTSPFPKNLP